MGGDARGQQGVDETLVEIEPLGIDRAGPFRKDARPGDTEAEMLHPQVPHQLHILGKAVIEIAGHGGRVPPVDGTRLPGVGIPDALPLAVERGRPLDLAGGRGRSPVEIRGEAEFLGNGFCRSDGAFLPPASPRKQRRGRGPGQTEEPSARVTGHGKKTPGQGVLAGVGVGVGVGWTP